MRDAALVLPGVGYPAGLAAADVDDGFTDHAASGTGAAGRHTRRLPIRQLPHRRCPGAGPWS